MLSRGLCGAVAFLIIAAAVGAGETVGPWSKFRGPTGMGVSTAKGIPTKWGLTDNLAWKIKMPGPGTSSPIIVGERLFLTYYTGYNVPRQPGSMENLRLHVLCLERSTGKTIWSKEVMPKLPEQKSIRDDHGYASATPIADAERLYVFFGKSGVHAFDHDGKHLWEADVGDGLNGWGSAAPPYLHGDLLYVNASVESEALVALDKTTGKERWRQRGINESWNMPIVVKAGEREELVVAIMGKILAFDPKTGTPLWNCKTDIGWYMVPSLVAHEGIVYCIGGRSGGSLAVKTGGSGDVTRTHRLWTGKTGSNVSSPIYHAGHLYYMHEAKGIAYCADAATGKIVYEENVGNRAEQFYSSPVLADGKLIYIDRMGKAFVLPAQPKFEILAVNTFGERSIYNASPAVEDGRLYIRSDAHLYCVGK